MKNKTLLRGTLSAFVIGLITGLSANAIAQEEKEMTQKDLPPAVLQAFEKAFPKAVITGVGREEIMGFEIESKDGNIQRNLVYLPDGNLFETEEACDAKALPDAIQKTIAKAYPKGEIEKAEKITRGSVVEYEVEIEAGEQENEVVLDPAGMVIKADKINEEDENGEKE
jgi:hypothetical protein